MLDRRFRLRPLARYWLRSPSGADEPDGALDAEGWAGWLIGRMAAGALLDVGGVLVDRGVLEQRFTCCSERCAPGPDRGKLRSCCADLDVSLTPAELRRLRRQTGALAEWLARREPRLGLRDAPRRRGARPFWLADDEAHLARPGGRCVFSALDRRGRIRCHLHGFARARGLERHEVQPLPCRLFPLVLLELPTGQVALTLIGPRTARRVGTPPASRLPCLADPTHPPLVRSAARDLDWIFGPGFAAALRALA